MGGEAGGGRERYLVLDGYRFLAAMGIVVFHYQYDWGLPLGTASRAFDKLYVYVDFFFVLSGFVIAQAYAGRVGTRRDYGSFLWKRLARIYPLHLATLLAMVAAVETFAATGLLGERNPIYDPARLPQNVLLVHAWGTTPDQSWNLPSWSISAEWAAYLAFPLLAALAARLPAWASAAVAVASAVLVHAASQSLGLFHWTNATSEGAMRALPTFFAGVAVSRWVSLRAGSLPRPPWWSAHLLFALPLALLHWGAPDEAAIALFPFVVALAACAERASGPSLPGRGGMVRLGHASYALYLIHFPVAFVAVHLLPPSSFAEGSPWRYAYASCVALACVAAAIRVHAAFEVPAQRRLAGLARRDGAGGGAGRTA